MTRLISSARAVCGLSILLLAAGCGDRPAAFDVAFDAARKDPTDPTRDLQVRGLTGSVALLDANLNQVMMFTSPRALELTTTRLPVGKDVVQFKTSVGHDKLFVLSRGVTPRYKDTDERPQLLVFDGGTTPQQLQQVELQDPYNELEVDPQGEWLLVHGSGGLVSNPNELLLVHLGADSGATPSLTSKTLGSYGGKPLRFTFTSELSIPGGAKRRLLIVQREKDLAIIDLAQPNDPEITVALPENKTPLDVVYHDGIDGEVSSMLGVQLDASPQLGGRRRCPEQARLRADAQGRRPALGGAGAAEASGQAHRSVVRRRARGAAARRLHADSSHHQRHQRAVGRRHRALVR